VAGDHGRHPTSGEASLRLFLAVEVPGDVRDLVVAATRDQRDRLPRARWVPAENLHVTLAFLGGVSPGRLAWVKERAGVASAGLAPFEVAVSGLGAFPRTGRIRVLWVGLDDPTEGLAGLARALADELAEEFPPQDRPFSAHLTLARADPPIAVDRGRLAATELRSEPFLVERACLFRSHLGRSTPRYEALASFPLGTGAADPPAAR
jgi:2'-5' RNA ligase